MITVSGENLKIIEKNYISTSGNLDSVIDSRKAARTSNPPPANSRLLIHVRLRLYGIILRVCSLKSVNRDLDYGDRIPQFAC